MLLDDVNSQQMSVDACFQFCGCSSELSDSNGAFQNNTFVDNGSFTYIGKEDLNQQADNNNIFNGTTFRENGTIGYIGNGLAMAPASTATTTAAPTATTPFNCDSSDGCETIILSNGGKQCAC